MIVVRGTRIRWPCRTTLLVGFAVMLGLPGCTPWPAYGTGGLAERHPTLWPEARLIEDRCLEVLRKGGRDIAAGRIDEIRILMVRALREYEGGLPAEAQLTLERAELILSGVEHDLRKVRPSGRTRTRSG